MDVSGVQTMLLNEVPPRLSLGVFSPLPAAIAGSGKEVSLRLAVAQHQGTCFLFAGILSIGLAAAYYSGGESSACSQSLPQLFGKLRKEGEPIISNPPRHDLWEHRFLWLLMVHEWPHPWALCILPHT